MWEVCVDDLEEEGLMDIGGQAGRVLACLCLMDSICALGSIGPNTCAAESVDMGFTEQNAAGQDAIRRKDYVAAERHFRLARKEAESAGNKEFIREMDARRAAMYINDGEPSRAVLILAPYIKPGVDKFMLSDYLMALRLTNRSKEAVQVFQTYVADWQAFPVYGLQTIGDIYLRQGKYAKACEIYRYILDREKEIDVPYVQLGYAYCLAKTGKSRKALAAYGKVANLGSRVNNIIAGDGNAFIADGHWALARDMYALLGDNDGDKEAYQLEYARNLVNAGQDYANESLNFKRDECLEGSSYNHEAAKVLRRLLKSQNKDIVHEAEVLQAANKMHNELLADSRKALQDLLKRDRDDVSVLAVQGEYERQQLHNLVSYYDNSVDNRGNRQQSAGLGYNSYWGHNVYVSRDYSRHWLHDDDDSATFWQSTLALRKKMTWGEFAGEWIRYDDVGTRSGYALSWGYDFNDKTHMDYEMGRRLHKHVGAINAGIREKYQEVTLSHQLTPKTRLAGSYQWANLTDDNKYREYSFDIDHLLQVKHNYSDRLETSYSRGRYAQEVGRYDSPGRRVDYSAGFSRKWNFPKINTIWQWQTNLSWGKDNDEHMAFSPQIKLMYQHDFLHNQSLQLGIVYRRYYRQMADGNRRHEGYGAEAGYTWRW